MCGIAGYWCASEKNPESIIRKMNLALAHRGPDAEGIYIDQKTGLALGHRRLSIIDLTDAANQPIYDSTRRYVMVYNGEVYNYRELHQKYIPHYQPHTTSDSEIILQLFIELGAGFVNRLNGMFAMAIYDTLEKQLYIYRDRLGVKPLFYIQQNGYFIFASEIKALEETGFPLSINLQSIPEFLHLGYIPQPRTIWQEVKKFPAGHWMRWNAKGTSLEPYWELHRKFLGEAFNNELHALSELKNLVESSVKYRMISDVPFGTFLSGGIDSSLVTAVACQNTSQLNTFSIGFDIKKHDESKYAKQIADYLGTRHTAFTVTEKEAMQWVERLTDVYDEPFADSSAIPTLMVSQLASQQVKMVLTGDGGDEQFMGYGAYQWAHRMNHPVTFAFRKLIAATLRLGNNRLKRASMVFEANDKKHLAEHIFSQEQYLFCRKEILHICNTPLHIPEIELLPPKRTLSAAEYQSYFDLNYYLRDDLLVKVDRASMHFGLEAREPLLDYRIVEWSINLHESLKKRNGIQKYILKQLLYQYIPSEYFNRPKWGFSIPLDRWLAGPLSYLLDEYLGTTSLKKTGIFDEKAVHRIITRFKKGEPYLYNRLWTMIVLQIFAHRKNIEFRA
ncbi:MAG: asparagine synthase (glutamine-hydrolyzing) [Flavobacteriales bacterium]|nr:asparagine synthase (glutamine-hydrolyzing) [Flavobacteriales bacterium]